MIPSRTNRVLAALSCLWLGAWSASCCLDPSPSPSPSAVTDDPVVREQARGAAQAHLETQWAALTDAPTGEVTGATIHGGTLQGISPRAFEVRLGVAGADRVTEVVVYLHLDDAMTVAGAQSRDAYGAVVHDQGGRLDRRFRSRD